MPLGTHTVAFLDVQPLEAIATYLAVHPEGNLAHTQPLLYPYVQSLQALPADDPSHVVEMSCSVLEAVLAPWTVQRGESVFDVCIKTHCVGPSSYQIRISLYHDFLFYVYMYVSIHMCFRDRPVALTRWREWICSRRCWLLRWAPGPGWSPNQGRLRYRHSCPTSMLT